VRQWLISKGFQGLEGQKMPEMNDDIVNEITDRYIELFNILSEQPFEKNVYENREQLLEKRVKEALKSLGVSVE
jgi:phosphoribosylaminoimidazole-succinocarboxamide synthase